MNLFNEKNTNSNLKTLNILLAEDDEINQKIYLLGFEKYFKTIEVAENGEEVISKFEKTKYDAIVMDIQMPKINGIEATQKIRLIEQNSNIHTAIIAITANSLIYNKNDILKFGFDDYFIKPFKMKEIFYKIIELLENK